MHPSDFFINPQDRRIPAFWRILFQFILFIIFFTLLQFALPNDLPYVLNHTLPLIACTLSIYVCGRWLDKRPFLDFGLHLSPQWWRECGLGVGIGFVAMGAIFAVFWLLGWLDFTGFGWDRGGTDIFAISISIYFLHMAMVGFYEELFSRGYHLKNMMEGFRFGSDVSGKRAAFFSLLTSSLIFGLMHAGNSNFGIAGMVGITIAGLLLGIPYIMTGRLGYAIGLHFSWNFAQGAVFGFPVSGNPFRESLLQHRITGPEWLTGGAFGPEAGVLPFIILILAGVISVVLLVRSGVPFKVHESFK